VVLLVVAILIAGCGGDVQQRAVSGMYPPGSKTEEDVFNELKYDSRVKDYETSDNRLLVNVDEVFQSSPPGVQERALRHWYNLWQAARGGDSGKKLEVVARSSGNDVAKWTTSEGYQLVAPKKVEGETPSE
jgi:hypothetical protein